MRNHFLSARAPTNFCYSRLRSLYPGLVLLIVLSLIIAVGEQSVYAVAAPSPPSPVDGTTTAAANYPPLGIPEFTWTSVASTNTYHCTCIR